MSTTSWILVLLQFISFGWFLLSGNLLADGGLLYIQLAGLALSLWGAKVMGLGKFNIQPEVRDGSGLVQAGPYRLLRNPMYTGILLFFGAATASHPSFSHIASLVLLTLTLLLKIRMEENFLGKKFAESYAAYKKKSYRLIPFIF